MKVGNNLEDNSGNISCIVAENQQMYTLLRQLYQNKEISFEEYDNTLKTLAEEIYNERAALDKIKNVKLTENVYAAIAAAVSSNVADLAADTSTEDIIAAIPVWSVSANFNRGCITLKNRLVHFPALLKHRECEHDSIILEGEDDYSSNKAAVILVFSDNDIFLEIYKGNENDFDYLMKTLKRLQKKLNLKLDLSNIQNESITLLGTLDKLQQLVATFGEE